MGMANKKAQFVALLVCIKHLEGKGKGRSVFCCFRYYVPGSRDLTIFMWTTTTTTDGQIDCFTPAAHALLLSFKRSTAIAHF